MSHDHAAMVASTTVSMNYDHYNATGTIDSVKGFQMKDMMMMAMTFHGGYKEQILFDQWNTETVGAFVASCIKTLRDNLAKRDLCRECTQTQTHQQIFIHTDGQESERSTVNDLIPSVRTENHQTKRTRLLSFSHILQSFLHIIQMGISYLLMLIAMTFNSYLLLAVILGAGFGHFLFGWRRSSVIDHNEHCH